MEIRKETLENFLNDYNTTMDELRNQPITDDAINIYSDVNPIYAKYASGGNLIETSFLLKKIQPDLANLLFNMGNTLIESVQKELQLKENLDITLQSDPKMEALLKDLSNG